jgi:hypothetical protein
MPIQTPRADHSATVPQWNRCRDVIAGGDRVKAKRESYLPKLADQSEVEYSAYVTRANFFNGVQRSLASLVGSVFRSDPDVKVPDAVKPALDEHLTDVTLDGVPFLGFAIEAIEEVLSVGRMGMLVDMPGDATTAPAAQRPYWVSYEAEQIINWDVKKIGTGYQLALVVLKETVELASTADPYTPQKKEQFRVLELVPAASATGFIYRVRLFEWVTDATGKPTNQVIQKEEFFPARKGQSLTFIPFVFLNPTTIRPALEKPPLLDMVDVNLSHYRSSADYEHGLHFTGLPTAYVVGAPSEGGSLKIGSGTAWTLDGPNAKAGYLEFTGQGLTALKEAIEAKEVQMDVLGAKLMDKGGHSETAESVRSRYASAHATLKTIVTTASQALTQVLRWHVWWTGAEVPETDVNVKLNHDFFETILTAQDVQSLILAHQSGEISFETLYFNLRRGGLTRPGIEVEEERALIDKEQEAKMAAAAAVIAATNAGAENPDANPEGAAPETGVVPPPGVGQGDGNVPPSGAL